MIYTRFQNLQTQRWAHDLKHPSDKKATSASTFSDYGLLLKHAAVHKTVL